MIIAVPMIRALRQRYGGVVLGILLAGIIMACTVATPPVPTLPPQLTTASPRTPSPAPPQPTITPLPPDTGWQTTQAGIEVRSLNVPASQSVERVTVARLDPARVSVQVLYTPGAALPVSLWAKQHDALLVINGGYFTSELYVTGLTISQGQIFGTPYDDFAGMLAVTNDGAVSVRWLRTSPYDPAEPLRGAVQSFPVLVKPGGVMGFPADADDGRTSRRTVVAQDSQGRLLFIIAPRGYLSLHELAVWLADSDLDVDVALNLDGGTSSGFWMPDGPNIDSMIPIPAVIAVFPQ